MLPLGNSKKNFLALLLIVQGERNMNEWNHCTNEECKYKNRCKKYLYVNDKVTNKFYLKKYNPETCGEFKKGEK